MNYLDLFSGIGGFALGARLAGINWDSHYFSEIEPYAIKVYQKNFPQAIGLGDIKGIDGTELRNRHKGDWIITGGFPCQDISVAGKHKGISGSRSNLWFEMLRLIDEIRPAYIIAENVSAIRSKGLERVLLSLAKIGYDAEWNSIRASQVNAPHRRERIWIVAYPNGNGFRSIDQLPTQERDLGKGGQADNPTYGNLSWANWQAIKAEAKANPESFICRMDDGIPNKVDRIRGLGNAIVPQIAAMIFNRIRGALAE